MYNKTSLNILSRDFLVVGWVNYTIKELQEEIRASKHRCEIDDDEFTFTFIEKLPEELMQKLNKDDFYEVNEFDSDSFKKRILSVRDFVSTKRKLQGLSIGDNEFEHLHSVKIDQESKKSEDTKKSNSVSFSSKFNMHLQYHIESQDEE